MDISVVVPFFNSQRYIEACIQSLLHQDYPSNLYEIILVDNNSTDMSGEIVNRYPRIRLLQEPLQSAYAARNLGIRSATGRIIAFTDSDCEATPQWLSTIESFFDHPGREIVLGKREYVSPSLGLRMLSDYESVLASHVFTGHRKELYFGYTNNMAVRASLFEKLGGFRMQHRGADTVFVRRAVEAYGSGIVGFTPRMLVRHLEVTTTSAFYKKRLIYGKSTKSNRHIGSARPLSNTERLAVFLETIRDRRYSFLKASLLLAFLSVGLLFYEVGRRRGE